MTVWDLTVLLKGRKTVAQRAIAVGSSSVALVITVLADRNAFRNSANDKDFSSIYLCA